MVGIYFIAEAGVNHNGDIGLARKLVDVATLARVDAVKFQTFKTELLVTKDAEKAEYQKAGTQGVSTQFEMLRQLELTENQFLELQDLASSGGLEFISTPHSGKWSLDLLERMGVPRIKIGSGDLTNLPFLSDAAAIGVPIILSTGMGTMEEIAQAVDCVETAGATDLSLLQCTSLYPCPNDKANIRAMEALRTFGHPVGFSDHTMGLEACVIATCLGATVLEKHFTLDRTLPGPDQQASVEPSELKDLVACVRFVSERGITDPALAFQEINEELGIDLDRKLIDPLLGNAEKVPQTGEDSTAAVARKSVTALQDIPTGHCLTADDIGIRRPAGGIPPRFISALLGRQTKRELKQHQTLKWEDIVGGENEEANT